jgi:hypothetical protein
MHSQYENIIFRVKHGLLQISISPHPDGSFAPAGQSGSPLQKFTINLAL